jgi:ribonucleoside-diphosphate reductase alpha chain
MNFTGGNWEAEVLSIEPAGIEKVYDLYEPRSDTWITGGYVSRGCGEQFLGPYENCCLGSVNLAQHYTDDGRVDCEKLRESVELSTRFLDHVVTANGYVPAVPQLREAAERVRRIGLGIMGLGDLMYAAGVRYGSKEGQEFASQVMEFVRYHSMRTSIELARQYGAFPAIEGSRYDPNNLKWTVPQPIVDHVTDWGRPIVDWEEIETDLKRYGIRNGAQTTIAPTGTISTVSGCEGYGCEPVFALAYMRYVNINAGNSEARETLQYTSPLFQKALENAGLSPETIKTIVEQVNNVGTCQEIDEVPDHIKRVFVVASDVATDEHIWMQASMQAFVDNAISKTINMPASATQGDVAQAYQLGWNLGCKGLTVYVTGSRDKVVLETKATAEQKTTKVEELPAEAVQVAQIPLFNEDKKPRPRRLVGKTYRTETPAGTTYVTINENGEGPGQPFEVFIHTAKAGSEVTAVAEAMGRLLSQLLRMASPVSPRQRLKEVVRQLSGIGGQNPLGFGPHRVLSLPDGLAQIFAEYLEESEGDMDDPNQKYPRRYLQQQPLITDEKPKAAANSQQAPMGDLCPECGSATLVNEEGCQKCYSCGYSRC